MSEVPLCHPVSCISFRVPGWVSGFGLGFGVWMEEGEGRAENPVHLLRHPWPNFGYQVPEARFGFRVWVGVRGLDAGRRRWEAGYGAACPSTVTRFRV